MSGNLIWIRSSTKYRNIIRIEDDGDEGANTVDMEEEKDSDIEGFVTVKEDGLSIDRVYSKKRYPQGPQDIMVQSKDVKITLL